MSEADCASGEDGTPSADRGHMCCHSNKKVVERNEDMEGRRRKPQKPSNARTP